ncbi:hypothetical protein ACSNOH_35020, partial [Streptomyces sp. URMC 127]|uniref:hypothetical protein n=1 Tax=Streptomyces sp. URMC 127 TaxID=3423402 RepID=UPI003F1938E6
MSSARLHHHDDHAQAPAGHDGPAREDGDGTSLFDRPSARLVVAEVAGDRWTGKTSLLSRLTRTASARGWEVAAGHATVTLSAVPYGIFVDALDGLLARTDPLSGPAHHHITRLTGIFPALAPAGGA